MTRVSCLFLIWSTVAASLVAQSSTRRVVSNGHPIEQQLRPDDQSVILTINADPPLLVDPPTGVHVSEAMADHTSIAFYGTVIQRESHLTADRSWVRSSVTMRVNRLLKPYYESGAKPDALIRFVEDGGTVRVGAVLVEGVVPWSRPMRVGQQYLVFGNIGEDGGFITGPASTYELASEFGLSRFRRLMPAGDKPNDIEELLANEVLDRIDRRAQRARQ